MSAGTHTERRATELLAILLTDLAADVEVVARDLGISAASFTRCQRAMDRLSCAQAVLETMRVGGVGVAGELEATRGGGQERMREEMRGAKLEAEMRGAVPGAAIGRAAMRRAVDVVAEMRTAVELLARGWPEDYPPGQWSGSRYSIKAPNGRSEALPQTVQRSRVHHSG